MSLPASDPTSPSSKSRLFNTSDVRFGLALGLFLIALFVLLSIVVLLPALSPVSPWLPYPLHSLLLANYNADGRLTPLAPVNPAVILEMIRDQGVTPEAYAGLSSQLLTPVPSVTPLPGQAASTQNFQATSTLSASASKTSAPSPTPALTRSATPSLMASAFTATTTGTATPTTSSATQPNPDDTQAPPKPKATATSKPPTEPPPPPKPTATEEPPPPPPEPTDKPYPPPHPYP